MKTPNIYHYQQQIDQILKALRPENRAYFDQLEQYMTSTAFTHDEEKLYEQIYTMARDLQEAEKDGLTAEGFFGTQPKDIADELLANSPKNPLRRLLEFTVVFMAVNLFLPFFKTGQLTVDMVKELVTAGLMLAGLAFVYRQLKKKFYKTPFNPYRKTVWYGLVFGMLLPRLTEHLPASGLLITIPSPLDSVVLLGIIAILAYKVWPMPRYRILLLPALALWFSGFLEQWQSRGVDVGMLSSYWFKSLLVLATIGLSLVTMIRKQRQERGLD